MQSMSPSRSERFLQNTIALQFTILDRFVNPRQVLIDNSTCSQVEVADFRVAHLSLRQADILAACT